MRIRTLFLVAGAAVGIRALVRTPRVRRLGRSFTHELQALVSGQAHPRLPAELVEPARDDAPVEQLGMLLDEAATLPGGLVDAERELLTVAGDEHRLREQRSGVASQQIAAAQVRLRRNSTHDELDEFDQP
jgi:hypothetical protein